MLSPNQRQAFAAEFRHRLEQKIELPPLPEVARELLLLRNNTKADVVKLTAVVERDPGVAAQLLSYARLSVFGYGSRIKTLEEAVQLVLGYEKALHMAMGIAAGKSLQMQAEGPLGRKAFWQHSLHTAMLTQALASALPLEQRPQPGIGYLAGLLHDIGYMLFGHLYPKEFAMLNKLIGDYPSKSARELELLGFGISHDMIGLRLMQAWNMPEEIVVAVSEHFFFDYDGKYAIYPKLVALANQLLKIHANNSSMASNKELIRVDTLGLDDERVMRALDRVLEVSPQLEAMARDLAA
jgi:HD-like signal output (HDOD) protein